MFRIAAIPYLNCAPFFWNRTVLEPFREDLEFVAIPPRQIGEAARRGEVDAGPISLTDALDLEADFEPLGDFGIACPGPARSVLLFSKIPLEGLDGRRVALSSESSTSNVLLEILLRERYRLRPLFSLRSKKAQARLWIGDAALRRAQEAERGKIPDRIFDLGTEWKRWQELPFVFARWMVRKEAPEKIRRALERQIRENLSPPRFERALEWHERRAGPATRDGIGYLKGFRYRLGEPELESIARFRRLGKGRVIPSAI